MENFYDSIDEYLEDRIDFLKNIENAGGRECLSNSRYRRSGRTLRLIFEALKQMSLHPGCRVYIFAKKYNSAKSITNILMKIVNNFNIPYSIVISQECVSNNDNYTAGELRDLRINGLIKINSTQDVVYVYDHTCFE